ncbi:MAG: hypothetical protein A2147_05610 [Chloroflexi bacterium RBG_16_57_8]|nr:MAG: hypothetical protein A2147_05610 [Chloroflexi bacterium RBG_16_57_8]
MARVKDVLGPVAGIGGNISLSLLDVGTVQQVKDQVKQLIKECAKGGGYIVMTGAAVDQTKAENLKAMVEAVKEFGKY